LEALRGSKSGYYGSYLLALLRHPIGGGGLNNQSRKIQGGRESSLAPRKCQRIIKEVTKEEGKKTRRSSCDRRIYKKMGQRCITDRKGEICIFYKKGFRNSRGGKEGREFLSILSTSTKRGQGSGTGVGSATRVCSEGGGAGGEHNHRGKS